MEVESFSTGGVPLPAERYLSTLSGNYVKSVKYSVNFCHRFEWLACVNCELFRLQAISLDLSNGLHNVCFHLKHLSITCDEDFL